MLKFTERLKTLLCKAIPKPPTALPSPAYNNNNITTKMIGSSNNNSNMIFFPPKAANITAPKNNLIFHTIIPPTTGINNDINKTRKNIITFPVSQQPILSTANTIHNINDNIPTPKLTLKQQIYKDLRGLIGCGDKFPECNTSADCGNNTMKCYNQECVPNLLHCTVTKCSSEYERCDPKSGECVSTRRSCATNNDCANGFICEDNQCFKEKLFCRDDRDCGGLIDNGEPKPKCDLENKTCVPCLHGQRSLCEHQNPEKPSCHVTQNVCWERCDPVVTNFDKCCDALQILDTKAKTKVPNRLENCCSVLPQNEYWVMNWEGLEKCCLDSTNSGPGKRDCRNWAGKSGNNTCCNYGLCDMETGQCT